MQVISGKYKGCKLKPPPTKARPTTGKAKEAWASIIENNLSAALADAVIIDLFAGSGGLGIELLSRGAKHCTFCEIDKSAVATIKQNLEPTDSAYYNVIQCNAFQNNLIKKLALRPADVLILDPPYTIAPDQISQLLDKIIENQVLNRGALISYEHLAKQPNVVPLSEAPLSASPLPSTPLPVAAPLTALPQTAGTLPAPTLPLEPLCSATLDLEMVTSKRFGGTIIDFYVWGK